MKLKLLLFALVLIVSLSGTAFAFSDTTFSDIANWFPTGSWTSANGYAYHVETIGCGVSFCTSNGNLTYFRDGSTDAYFSIFINSTETESGSGSFAEYAEYRFIENDTAYKSIRITRGTSLTIQNAGVYTAVPITNGQTVQVEVIASLSTYTVNVYYANNGTRFNTQTISKGTPVLNPNQISLNTHAEVNCANSCTSTATIVAYNLIASQVVPPPTGISFYSDSALTHQITQTSPFNTVYVNTGISGFNNSYNYYLEVIAPNGNLLATAEQHLTTASQVSTFFPGTYIGSNGVGNYMFEILQVNGGTNIIYTANLTVGAIPISNQAGIIYPSSDSLGILSISNTSSGSIIYMNTQLYNYQPTQYHYYYTITNPSNSVVVNNNVVNSSETDSVQISPSVFTVSGNYNITLYAAPLSGGTTLTLSQNIITIYQGFSSSQSVGFLGTQPFYVGSIYGVFWNIVNFDNSQFNYRFKVFNPEAVSNGCAPNSGSLPGVCQSGTKVSYDITSANSSTPLSWNFDEAGTWQVVLYYYSWLDFAHLFPTTISTVTVNVLPVSAAGTFQISTDKTNYSFGDTIIYTAVNPSPKTVYLTVVDYNGSVPFSGGFPIDYAIPPNQVVILTQTVGTINSPGRFTAYLMSGLFNGISSSVLNSTYFNVGLPSNSSNQLGLQWAISAGNDGVGHSGTLEYTTNFNTSSLYVYRPDFSVYSTIPNIPANTTGATIVNFDQGGDWSGVLVDSNGNNIIVNTSIWSHATANQACFVGNIYVCFDKIFYNQGESYQISYKFTDTKLGDSGFYVQVFDKNNIQIVNTKVYDDSNLTLGTKVNISGSISGSFPCNSTVGNYIVKLVKIDFVGLSNIEVASNTGTTVLQFSACTPPLPTPCQGTLCSTSWKAPQNDVSEGCSYWDSWVALVFPAQGLNDMTRFEFSLAIIAIVMIMTLLVSKGSFGAATTIGFFPYAFFLFLSLSTPCGTYMPTWTGILVALIVVAKMRWF